MRREHLVRRIVAATVLLFGVLLATPGISAAAPAYPAPPAPGTVSSGTVAAGGTVTFSGSGFTPGETVHIGVSYGQSGDELGSTVASASGTFTFEAELTRPGNVTLIAIGETSERRVYAAVRVLAAGSDNGTGNTGTGNTGTGSGSGAGSSLPVTGTGPIAPIALGGAAALLLGVVLVGFTVVRRRRSTEV
jgi:hypothetical protein